MDRDSLRRLVADGGLSRREFVGLAVASGMSLAAAQVMFGSARAAEPKKGGRFRLGVAGATTQDSHDPATWGVSALVNIGLWGAVYNNLMEVAPDGTLVPELAETVEPAAGAKTWVFKLRPGVTFHNGKTLDSEDVVASFNHHRGPESQSAAKAIVDPIVDIRADGASSSCGASRSRRSFASSTSGATRCARSCAPGRARSPTSARFSRCPSSVGGSLTGEAYQFDWSQRH
jgi:ABC-type transport system substrate-binding protein